MNINFHLDTSQTGYDPSQIFVLVLGTAVNTNAAGQPVADGDFSYLDFKTGNLVKAVFNNQVTDAMVSSLQALNPNASATDHVVSVPPIGSARLYVSFGQSLTAIKQFTPSGPVNGKDNTVIYDKFEFDNAAHKNPDGSISDPNPNVNLTSVDFYGLSFTITAKDTNTSTDKTIGFSKSRADILATFNAIKDGSGTDGNPAFFKNLIIKDASGTLVRILAPKAPGPADFGSTNAEQVTAVTQRTHFWRDYVNNKCYVAKRQFSCYSKLNTPVTPGPKFFGTVDDAGLNILLFTDAEMKTPYAACPSLPRPSNVGNQPGFSKNWNDYNRVNTDPNNPNAAVDWGFLLSANTEGTAAPHWASDPVAMSIMLSICRGCMHLPDADDWVDPKNWYTSNAPIFYYSSILHDMAVDNLAYAFSYDDIFGKDPTIYFKGNMDVTVKFGVVKAIDINNFWFFLPSQWQVFFKRLFP